MGSTRLPGKVLEPIEGRPLVGWTLAAFRAVATIDEVVLATTVNREDEPLVAFAAPLGPVHRGSARDVLGRVWGAARPQSPDIVVRGTADNPFPDPDVIAAQIDRCVMDGFDYVGTAGWPIGIAAEVARVKALEAAVTEAIEPADREHVMPFLYRHPERFRIGALDGPTTTCHPRYTVDTAEDLAFARAVAARVGHGPPIYLAELEAVVAASPELRLLNSDVRQKGWHEVES
ncbi:MAG: putative Aminotransferase, class pyridoxal-phosphate dependent [Chloroflexi bacterium]|jgi:spore coat polysaccharide biosynthesis protein SpsF|nr:putative Aminotransferase, class pyridoxal-phosphate dependent [Chloroflexota bacterium]